MSKYAKLNRDFPGLNCVERYSLQTRLQETANRNGAVLMREKSQWILWWPGHKDKKTKTLLEMAKVLEKLRSEKIFA